MKIYLPTTISKINQGFYDNFILDTLDSKSLLKERLISIIKYLTYK